MGNFLHSESQLLQTKFEGCLLGLAVGDAIGAAFEGSWFPDTVTILAAVEKKPLLYYTDDTHMAIGVAESLTASRGFNGQDMAERFTSNYEQEPWRGYGPGPPRIFKKIRDGLSWDRAAEDIYPGGSYGNGSAMRAAPVGLFYHQDQDKLSETARLQSQITHSHALGKEGAALQALAVAFAVNTNLNNPARSILDQLITCATDKTYLHKLTLVENLLNATDIKEIVYHLGNGIKAIDSVPTAICCALRHPESYEKTVLEAVSLGGDADTIASMAGAISGALLGVEAIPKKWSVKLENRDYLEKLATDLLITASH